MAILRIARMGHPVLRQVAEPVPPEQIPEPSFQRLIDDMLDTLRDHEGAGLAAPQVHVSLRLVLLAPDPQAEPLVLINPEITFLTQNMLRSFEGCLSVPDLRGAVNRVGQVRVVALDREGEPVELELEGFAAIAVQHECDHLDGALYIDRCDLRTLAFLDELRRFGPLDPTFRKSGSGESEPEPGVEDPPVGEPGPEPSREPRASSRSYAASPALGAEPDELVMAGGPWAEG